MTIQLWLPESKVSVAVLMLAVAVAYIERTALSHALPFILDEISISKSESGWVLSAFAIGYVISLPASGRLILRFGHARTLRWLAAGWVTTAVAFSLTNDYRSMAIVRFALGLFEGPLFPLFISWISIAARAETRPVTIGVVEACSYVGMALAGPITVAIAYSVGWRVSYAMVGGIGLLAWISSYWLIEPKKPPRELSADITPKPVRRLAERVVLSSGLIAAGFLLYNTAKSFYSTWFPTLLVKEFGLTSANAAGVTFVQSIAAPSASLIAAATSVWLIRKGITVPVARCLPLSAGFALGATVLGTTWLSDSVVGISIVAFLGLISTSALIWNAVPDNVDPMDVGMAAGWINAIANIGSILSPVVVGYLIEISRDYVLAFVSIVCLAAAPTFILAYTLGRKDAEQV